jgi:hypothetical protein
VVARQLTPVLSIYEESPPVPMRPVPAVPVPEVTEDSEVWEEELSS